LLAGWVLWLSVSMDMQGSATHRLAESTAAPTENAGRATLVDFAKVLASLVSARAGHEEPEHSTRGQPTDPIPYHGRTGPRSAAGGRGGPATFGRNVPRLAQAEWLPNGYKHPADTVFGKRVSG
jgi:hypothetical protein